MLSTDPFLERDDEVRSEFFAGLHGCCRSSIPRRSRACTSTALKVQPLQVLSYSSLVPRVTTRHPDFFVLNTAQFVNATLNNNEVIRAVSASGTTTEQLAA